MQSAPESRKARELARLVLVEHSGENPQAFTSERTGLIYHFERTRRLYVDMRDAVFMLNEEIRQV